MERTSVKNVHRNIFQRHKRKLFLLYTSVIIVAIQVMIAYYAYNCETAYEETKVDPEFFVTTESDVPYPDFSSRLYINSRFRNSNTSVNVNKRPIRGLLDNTIVNHVANKSNVLCPQKPPDLRGKVEIDTKTEYNFDMLEKMYDYLEDGGFYSPQNCKSRQKIAIIVTYRNRKYHLSFFFKHIHSFLRRQQVTYRIFVVESEPSSEFNKGLQYNAGFLEASKMMDFDCYIFHDVDLLPENDLNLYRCMKKSPRHLSVAVDTLNYTLSCDCYIGGVSAFTKEQFLLVNGYSNKYYGWGGEDDDLLFRIKANNLNVSRIMGEISRYTMLSHSRRKPNPSRWQLLELGKKRWPFDGLSSANYTVLNVENLKLCTYILIDYDKNHPALTKEIYPDLQTVKKVRSVSRPFWFHAVFISLNLILLIILLIYFRLWHK